MKRSRFGLFWVLLGVSCSSAPAAISSVDARLPNVTIDAPLDSGAADTAISDAINGADAFVIDALAMVEDGSVFPEEECLQPPPSGQGRLCGMGSQCSLDLTSAGCNDQDGDQLPDDLPNCQVLSWACTPSGMRVRGDSCLPDLCVPGTSCALFFDDIRLTGAACFSFCNPLAGTFVNPACSTTTGMSRCFSNAVSPYRNLSICSTPCRLGQVSDCPPLLDCKVLFSEGVVSCWGTGPVPLGGDCSRGGTAACARGASCVGGVCQRTCDPNLPCPAGSICMPISTGPPSAGVCR
jgi:hypothetical protein